MPRPIVWLLLALLVFPAPGPALPAKHLDDSGPPPGYRVFWLPDDALYAGDRVSFITLPPADQPAPETLSLLLPGDALHSAGFNRFGIGGAQRAVLRWVWDTSALPPGKYPLTFSLQPDGTAWTQWVTLRPAAELPPRLGQSTWQQIETDCCIVFFASGTSAQRDLEDLLETSQEQAALAAARMHIDFTEPVRVVLLPRVLGHGGFASDEIYVSYLDRNYAGDAFAQVLHHEMVHILDGRLGGNLRPTMLVEGLAVYLSGGHFKPEPLLPRAAALLELGWYIRLEELAEDFYFKQHEIGYLQGAALVEYMVARWGYPAFDTFYRNIQPTNPHSHARALDLALQLHFGLSLAELERDFHRFLQSNPATPAQVTDVHLTVEFYDTVRRYQQALDPHAYFLSAWLLDIEDMQAEGITADYVRSPRRAANLALEALLINAEAAVVQAEYAAAEEYIRAVNAVLAAYENSAPAPFDASPLAAETLAVVRTVRARGYEPQQITLADGQARVLATHPESPLPVLHTLELVFEGGHWQVFSSGH